MKSCFYQTRLLFKPGKTIGKQNLRPANHTGLAFNCSNGSNLTGFLPVSSSSINVEKSSRIISHPDDKAGVRTAARLQRGAARIIPTIRGGY
jgi:hypothetical protein